MKMVGLGKAVEAMKQENGIPLEIRARYDRVIADLLNEDGRRIAWDGCIPEGCGRIPEARA